MRFGPQHRPNKFNGLRLDEMRSLDEPRPQHCRRFWTRPWTAHPTSGFKGLRQISDGTWTANGRSFGRWMARRGGLKSPRRPGSGGRHPIIGRGRYHPDPVAFPTAALVWFSRPLAALAPKPAVCLFNGRRQCVSHLLQWYLCHSRLLRPTGRLASLFAVPVSPKASAGLDGRPVINLSFSNTPASPSAAPFRQMADRRCAAPVRSHWLCAPGPLLPPSAARAPSHSTVDHRPGSQNSPPCGQRNLCHVDN
jgi:hypothetical protein